ncbi:MAG: PKD domain-containing protein [Flavobacteriaceae bacterium]|nr:MAG: PKD domain-containing protein [Flavobacteriaceae bacterium]
MKNHISKLFSAFIAIVCIMFTSCAIEQEIAVKADFAVKMVNNDSSAPVQVQIENLSSGADSYQWTCKGASVESYTQKNPLITYTKEGTYTIILKASNKDGNEDEKTVEVVIKPAIDIDFDWQMVGSDISPVTIQMVNKSEGALQSLWEIQGEEPQQSNEQNPKFVLSKAGTHIIKLTISNGSETISKEKTLVVKPAMEVDFNWSSQAMGQNLQAPLALQLNNLSSNANSYIWRIEGATPSVTTSKDPLVTFSSPGTFNIVLEATNDKETKKIEKQIVIYPNTNLLSFSNVKMGINTAESTYGCFFSSALGRVLKKGEIDQTNGSKIDFGFFGLSSSFEFNQFVSPNQLEDTTFNSIPGAIHTDIVNSQEWVGIKLTDSGFDAVNSGDDLSSIDISLASSAKAAFNKDVLPRVVLFKTSDGRKGAIKIKEYVSSGSSSYIVVDIKVQKQP